jgi:5-methyltetrahydrofolate--homocysteine methyltransferase
MMDAVYTHGALSGTDANCAGFIARFAAKPKPAEPKKEASTKTVNLYDAVIHGLQEQAGGAVRAMTGTVAPMEIINEHLIPALDKVGKDYEKKLIFLPQLLMSAEAAKAAFEAIKQYMSKQGKVQEKRAKIVLATVKGDIHDIGKNIVKVLLENYNFDVIDLGKNVAPETVAKAVVRERVKLAGLSALMTSTVVYMEETIRLLREQAPDCRIMVGGAVLTQEYADKIGADFYAKDAMDSVRYADEMFTA